MKTHSVRKDRFSPRWNLAEISKHEIGRPHSRLRNPIMSGMLEGITQSMYDVYRVVAATLLPTVALFTVPKGQQYNQGGATFTKTILHTNMTQSGVLPAPNKLIVRAIYLTISGTPGANPVPNFLDVQAFLYSALIDFRVNDKSYSLQAAVTYPAGGGVAGFIVNDATAAHSLGAPTNGWPDARNAYTLAYGGVPIEQQQGFFVNVDPSQDTAGYTTAAANVVPVGTGLNVTCKLDGTLFRAVQ